MSIKDISYKGFRYHGKLITSVITGRDATRAQIPPGLVQINLEGDCGTANASGVTITDTEWLAIKNPAGFAATWDRIATQIDKL